MNEIDFEALTESSPVQIWAAQPDGALDYVNSTVTRFFGRSAEQMLGEGWLGSLHPADIALTVERWTRSLVHGESYSMEFRLLRASDRQYYWHFAQAEPVRNDDGKIVRWVGSNTDINGLKRMVEVADARQEIVRRERDRLLRAFQDSPAAVAILMGPRLSVELANRKWESIAERGTGAGRSGCNAFPELIVQTVLERFERIFAVGVAEEIRELPLVLDHKGDGSPDETFWNVVVQPFSEPGAAVQELLVHATEVTGYVRRRS